jgi:hypothetical protein
MASKRALAIQAEKEAEQIETLLRQIAELTARVEALEAGVDNTPAPTRTRKPKAQELDA